jgi:endonuclease I
MKKYSVIFLVLFSYFSRAQPAGYYNSAAGKTCAPLKTALKTIVTIGNNPQSYGDLWTQYPLTDIKPRTVGTGSSNVIYDIYSSVPGGTDPYQFTPNTNQCGAYNSEADCYNREHSVPQSWFNGNTSNNGPATDYLHIFPTDGYVNGKRNNDIYGEVAIASYTSLNGSKLGTSSFAGLTGNVFEPLDSFKGDVARAFLYFVTRYENDMVTFATNPDAARSFDGNTFPSIKINYLKLMIKWHNLDPVSAKERARNNAAYTFQGNRNPFVDHPEYVDLVWNGTCPGLAALPVDIVYFTGKVDGNLLKLNWEIGTEINLNQYEIERSFNGTSYTKIGVQEAKGTHNYSFDELTDNIRGRRVYYRIKKVDKDGKFSYSDVFSIHLPLNTRFTVYPNPIQNNITLRLSDNANTTLPLQITDLTGRTLLAKKVVTTNGLINVNASSLSNGTYFIKLKINNEVLTAKVIVEK